MSNDRVKIGDNKPPTTEELLKTKHKDIFDRRDKVLAKLKKAKREQANPQTRDDCAKLDALVVEALNVANDADTIREREKKEPLEQCKAIDGLFNGQVRDILGTDAKKGGLARELKQAADDRLLEISKAEKKAAQDAADAARAQADKIAAQAAAAEAAGRTKQADIKTNQVAALDKEADRHEAVALAPIQQVSTNVGASGIRTSVKGVFTCTAINRAELDLEALRPYLGEDALKDAVNACLKLTKAETFKGAIVVEKAVGRTTRG